MVAQDMVTAASQPWDGRRPRDRSLSAVPRIGGHANLNFLKDPTLQEGAARHLGGSNLGFADGHATWVHARQVLAKCSDGTLTGLAPYCPSGTRELFTQNCGDPNGYRFLY